MIERFFFKAASKKFPCHGTGRELSHIASFHAKIIFAVCANGPITHSNPGASFRLRYGDSPWTMIFSIVNLIRC